MRTTTLKLVLPTLLLLSSVALAQGAPSPVPSVPSGESVPVWVFYWILGLVTAAATVWALVTKILWERGNRASALSEIERAQLQQLYEWHSRKDDDQIPLWYTPRSWLEIIRKLHSDHADVKSLLAKISEQNLGIIADLRSQIKESRGLLAQQQTKMLKLAVRVQRAVEALAGLRPPEIESVLDDAETEGEA